VIAHAPAPAAAVLDGYLEQLQRLHARLCPRQVLGLRMGLLAGDLLRLELPRPDKRLLALVETDGCFADGVAVATGCWFGRRTLRLVDHGKVAVTFVDLHTEQAVRVWPDPRVRTHAWHYAADAPSAWHAQLVGYQRMPDHELLRTAPVKLLAPPVRLLGPSPPRVSCAVCREEISNGREVTTGALCLCLGCAGQSYYRRLGGSGVG